MAQQNLFQAGRLTMLPCFRSSQFGRCSFTHGPSRMKSGSARIVQKPRITEITCEPLSVSRFDNNCTASEMTDSNSKKFSAIRDEIYNVMVPKFFGFSEHLLPLQSNNIDKLQKHCARFSQSVSQPVVLSCVPLQSCSLKPTSWHNSPFVKFFHSECCHYSGHNKWSKVKHVKLPRDQERSILYQKLSHQIKLAVRDGGSQDPANNSALASVLAKAKASGMPKNTMESAIAHKLKDAGNEDIVEVRGPSGCCLVLEVSTESLRRTKNSLGKILATHGVTFASPGASMYAFKKKGVIEISSTAEGRDPLTLDMATDLAIEVDAEDVSEEDNGDGTVTFKFLCEPDQLPIVKVKLDKTPFKPEMASVELIADVMTELTDDELQTVSALVDALENHREVITVHDNVLIE